MKDSISFALQTSRGQQATSFFLLGGKVQNSAQN
jgi:hypothetical protein